MKQRSLGKYLLSLAMHPDILQQFLNNPDELLKKSGLSAADKKLVKSNDLMKVLARIQEVEASEPGDVLLPQ